MVLLSDFLHRPLRHHCNGSTRARAAVNSGPCCPPSEARQKCERPAQMPEPRRQHRPGLRQPNLELPLACPLHGLVADQRCPAILLFDLFVPSSTVMRSGIHDCIRMQPRSFGTLATNRQTSVKTTVMVHSLRPGRPPHNLAAASPTHRGRCPPGDENARFVRAKGTVHGNLRLRHAFSPRGRSGPEQQALWRPTLRCG